MVKVMEMLDVVDEFGRTTGEQIERIVAHERGILHRTSHVWVARKRKEKIEILLQKRSANKDSYPGCYDISSAGHIPAGDDFKESAVRELEEELGIVVQEEELIYCGARRIHFQDVFHDKEFVDNQYSEIYLLWYDCNPEQLSLQKEEVEEVIWMELYQCIEGVKKQKFPNCIVLEELAMVENTVKNTKN